MTTPSPLAWGKPSHDQHTAQPPQSSDPRRAGPPGPAAADPIDAFFDSRADEATAERLAAALRSDIRTAGDFVRTQRMVSMFKQPVEGPDLTDAILCRLEHRRSFGARLRNTRLSGRRAAGIGLGLGVVALWAVDRYAPRTPAAPAAPATVATHSAPPPIAAPAPTQAAVSRARPTGGFAHLSMGKLDVRTLPSAPGTLVIFGGSGGSTRLPALPSSQWAGAERPRPIEWSAASGESILTIPALPPHGVARSGAYRSLGPR